MKKFLFLLLIVSFNGYAVEHNQLGPSLRIDVPRNKQTDLYDGIEIIGSSKFIKQTRQALDLLKSKSPDGFRMVKKYVGRIQLGKHSGMWAYLEPPTYEVAEKTAFHSVTWYAGSISHDSYHSKLFIEFKTANNSFPPNKVWTGTEVELMALRHQYKVLVAINAPSYEIGYVKKLGGNYFDVDRDGKFTWEDYEKRDW